MIEVFTTITNSYQYSRELGLSLALFQKSLPVNSQLNLIHRTEGDASTFLIPALADRLMKGQPPEFFLILKEPSLLAGKDAVSILEHFLIQNPGIDCVLPSDIRGVPECCHSPAYLTPRSFEAFVAGMDGLKDVVFPYDGREPFMFLIRSRVLSNIKSVVDIFQLPKMLEDRTAISQRAYIHPFFDYYMEKRADVVDMIPESVVSLLDIGCTRGGFGSYLKSQRSCRVVGIEMNPVEGNVARNVLDHVIIGDALQADVNGRYDCVTCLDVIEHFEEPVRLLARIRNEFLGDKGLLVLSVPNVGHWSIVEDLLAGRWDYLPVGILCNTHLRFFTRSSITGFLAENGFRILKIVGNGVPISEDMRGKYKMLAESGMEIDFSNLDISNYLVLAEKL
ncbi:MAG: class I SAM-dependent methyltransferase [Desulfatirhabdiaceae bacterium]